MESSLNYGAIIKKTLYEATIAQPRLQAIKLYPVCDMDTGHFLILATGIDKNCWLNTILFHARLENSLVVIEEDNFEDGLTSALISAGIPQNHIITGLDILTSENKVIF